jgi:hypothetical protein
MKQQQQQQLTTDRRDSSTELGLQSQDKQQRALLLSHMNARQLTVAMKNAVTAEQLGP